MAPILTARRHPWPRDGRRAIRLQRSLRPRLRIGGSPVRVRLVAGADIAYDPRRDRLLAAILDFRLPGLEVVAAATRWVLALCRGYRLPEPTRLADRFVGRALRGGARRPERGR